MKDLIIIVSIVLILSIVCIVGLSLNFDVDYSSNDNKLVFGEPFKHKEHTYEHAGLACCPCGVCHLNIEKKRQEEQDEDEEHTHELREFGLLIKTISTILVVMVLIAALHL